MPRVLHGDPVSITALMAQEGVTCTGATPSEYLGWVQYGFSKLTQCKSSRYAMNVGEQCPLKLVKDFLKLQLPDLHLRNSYVPSEITFSSNEAGMALGEPLDKTVIYNNQPFSV